MFDVTKVVKLPLDAIEENFRILDGQSKISNWLYNHLLDKANSYKQEFINSGNEELALTVYSKRGLRNLLPPLKKEYPFLKSVHSSPLKNCALRLSSAIQSHQQSKKGKRKGKVFGWPKFHSWKADWFSLLYDEPNKGFKVDITKKTLTLSLGLGEKSQRKAIPFTLKEAHLLKGYKCQNLRIIKQDGIYYAVFTVLAKIPKKKPIKRLIALDPNHKNLAYGVDIEGRAIEIEAAGWLKIHDKRIDELKSKRDSCQKKAKKILILDEKGAPTGKEVVLPSNRWQKLNSTLEKVWHKRREQTKTFMFTVAHRLCKQYDCIGIGDYTPKGNGTTKAMRRSMNNQSLIGQFKNTLKWVAEKSGKSYLEFDEKGTTRTCHCCGYVCVDGLDPSIRKWQCPDCRTDHLRDENAAKNGLKQILKDHAIKSELESLQVPCSGLDSVTERWVWRVLPSGMKVISRG